MYNSVPKWRQNLLIITAGCYNFLQSTDSYFMVLLLKERKYTKENIQATFDLQVIIPLRWFLYITINQ